MMRHAVLSLPLSFLIVLVAAIVLHEPATQAPPGATVPSRTSDAVVTQPVPRNKEAGRHSIVTVRRGETLSDLAFRVYGTREMTSALLDANRDALEGSDRVLPEGMTLRRP